MNEDSLIQVDGLLVNDFLRAENVRAAMKYQPRDDDVFIATYPKCGTTWTQYIVCNIFTGGNAPNNVTDFLLQAPYFDFMGADAPKKMPRPGALMTHLPFSMRRHSNKARYIYVARNPLMTAPSLTTITSWDTRPRPALTFPSKHSSPTFSVNKSTETHCGLTPKLFQRILDSCSLGNMREVFDCRCDGFVDALLELPEDKRLESMEVYRKKGVTKQESHEGSGRVRKGKIGDWKNHFTTPELLDTMKCWIDEKTKGTDVMRLWEDLNLP
ncbi:hypothetical protein MRX96_001933 [Rhipicephalus microplus]